MTANIQTILLMVSSEGRSIITNARQHRNRRYVFNVDIQDFFGSINFGRIRGYFIADKNFQLQSKVATVLAQIACFENALPQGSPCSPIISNLIGHIVDIHLAKLAARVGCTYTRYADDLTFSTNKPTFPNQIATASRGKRAFLATWQRTIPPNCKMRLCVKSQKRRACNTATHVRKLLVVVVNQQNQCST